MIRSNVVNRVAADFSLASAIAQFRTAHRSHGRYAFVTDGIDPDVVDVVNQIVRDAEVLHIAVDRKRLAAAGRGVIDFVAADGEMVDGFGSLRAIHRHSKRVCGASFCRGGDVVDVIIRDLKMAARAEDINSKRDVLGAGSRVIPNFETVDDDVAPVLDCNQAPLAVGDREPFAVDFGQLTRIARVSDVAAGR